MVGGAGREECFRNISDKFIQSLVVSNGNINLIKLQTSPIIKRRRGSENSLFYIFFFFNYYSTLQRSYFAVTENRLNFVSVVLN